MTIYSAVFKIFLYLAKIGGERRKLHKLEKKGLLAERDEIVKARAEHWGKYMVNLVGGPDTTVTVKGQENIPADSPVVFIANHQSFMDIPLVYGYTGRQTGIISKAEFQKVPVFSDWMRLTNCIFLQRDNPRQSIKAMADGVENVKKGHSMLIFPEGHRSKCAEVKEFHPGSFKLAFRAEVPIVPVTISNTYKLYEETGRNQPTDLTLIFHPAIPTKGLTKEEQREIPEKVHTLISESVKSLQPKKD